MVVDIKYKYTEILEDLYRNQEEVFLRYNYYTKKYRGDLLNDINVGLFLNENYQPTAQIFLRNKTGYIKTHLIFNKEGNRILDQIVINNK